MSVARLAGSRPALRRFARSVWGDIGDSRAPSLPGTFNVSSPVLVGAPWSTRHLATSVADSPYKFDPTTAARNVAKFWQLPAQFGGEQTSIDVYLQEIVSDRYALCTGAQILHDELQFSIGDTTDVSACAADLTMPSVVTTVATTACGDRIHQGDTADIYKRLVASRFATLSEIGEYKLEAFSPTGGGTDDGATLAHVTVAHQLDEPIRKAIYRGNASSYVLVALDLKTHCGRMDHDDGTIAIGRAQESRWREPRAACGAIIGTLGAYNPDNPVHRRLRRDLGEKNFEFLTTKGVKTPGGVDVTPAVAAAIVAIQGMLNTAQALTTELDERGVGHTTAALTINKAHVRDTKIYLARATVFDGKVKVQGLGTDATKYSARFVEGGKKHGGKMLVLGYEGREKSGYPVVESAYDVRYWKGA